MTRRRACSSTPPKRIWGRSTSSINNASGWVADTFLPTATDRLGRTIQHLDAANIRRRRHRGRARGGLLIATFAERHVARGGTWGRIVSLTSGGPLGFPEEVSYGAAKAALENLTMSAAFELAPYGVTANAVHPPVTDTGWVTPEVEAAVRESADSSTSRVLRTSPR